MPTTNITFTIDNADLQDYINAFSQDYQATLPDGSTNPQTQAQYAKAQAAALLANRVRNYRYNKLQDQIVANNPNIS